MWNPIRWNNPIEKWVFNDVQWNEVIFQATDNESEKLTVSIQSDCHLFQLSADGVSFPPEWDHFFQAVVVDCPSIRPAITIRNSNSSNWIQLKYH